VLTNFRVPQLIVLSALGISTLRLLQAELAPGAIGSECFDEAAADATRIAVKDLLRTTFKLK